MTERHTHLDGRAVAILVLLCALWGLQQVAIKVALPGVSPLMQAGLRSAIATVLLWFWMLTRGIPVLSHGTWQPGIVAGILFAVEFTLIYTGLSFTQASRVVVFVYTAPFVVTLGVHFLFPAERLDASQLAGMLLAFTGVAVVFGDGLLGDTSSRHWIGDLMACGGAVFWGLTTLVVRATRLSAAAPSRTLFYQLFVSALLLPLLSVILGEPGIMQLTPLVLGSVAFQSIVVAFASYLAWFWLIAHYPAPQISSYTFLAPVFGVCFGVWLLREPLTASLATGAVLVGAGIHLVNHRPLRRGSEAVPKI